MAEIFYDDSADLSVIQRRHVAVLGYGSQGHAHALSLRDSGVDVRVGLPEGSKSREKAANDGLRVVTPGEACEEADLIMVLIPDHLQRQLYAEAIAPSLVEGDALFFAHGLNIRYDLIQPPADVDVCMVAPKAPGHLVRRQFSQGRGNFPTPRVLSKLRVQFILGPYWRATHVHHGWNIEPTDWVGSQGAYFCRGGGRLLPH